LPWLLPTGAARFRAQAQVEGNDYKFRLVHERLEIINANWGNRASIAVLERFARKLYALRGNSPKLLGRLETARRR
jgi:hypothetical protein